MTAPWVLARPRGLGPSPVLAVPALRAWVKWHVHRRAIARASHVQSAPIRPLLPRDLGFTRGKRAADIVGNLLRKPRVAVDQPTTEIECVDVVSQAQKARFLQRDLTPSEPSHRGELGPYELDL